EDRVAAEDLEAEAMRRCERERLERARIDGRSFGASFGEKPAKPARAVGAADAVELHERAFDVALHDDALDAAGEEPIERRRDFGRGDAHDVVGAFGVHVAAFEPDAFDGADVAGRAGGVVAGCDEARRRERDGGWGEAHDEAGAVAGEAARRLVDEPKAARL